MIRPLAKGLPSRLHHTDLAGRYGDCVDHADLEQQRIDPVGAWRDELHLRPALAAVREKAARILEGAARHTFCDDTAAGEGFAIARLDRPDSALRYGQEGCEFNRILPGPETQVQSRRQCIRLKPCFAVEGDDPAVRERSVLAEQHEFLRDHADRIVRHDDDAEQPQHESIRRQQRDGRNDYQDQPPMIEEYVHDRSLTSRA